MKRIIITLIPVWVFAILIIAAGPVVGEEVSFETTPPIELRTGEQIEGGYGYGYSITK